ncbi:hypothetical protein MGU_01554 [Metarhizium guizhouense ARSEF 977]|uniref:Uncharacterized protein n=1 Tax=Metarhizium guizhouense (strain ARSEF 977) TaxID=1276136 RepID=A0A0B4IBH2_METGA|nr:hypothetical protein MGU_01554 [Metarhizium guizhouense ARSEF 977]
MSSSEAEMGDAHLGLEYEENRSGLLGPQGVGFRRGSQVDDGTHQGQDGAPLEARDSGVVRGVYFQRRVPRCVARLPTGAWASCGRYSFSVAVSAAADGDGVVCIVGKDKESIEDLDVD